MTVHGLDWSRAKWGKFASWYIKTGEKNAVRFADEIVVLSQCVKDYFKETYGRETVFIPNGVVRPVARECEEIDRICKFMYFHTTNHDYHSATLQKPHKYGVFRASTLPYPPR